MTDSLSTTAGDLPLEKIELEVGGRMWSILHTGALISHADENAFFGSKAAEARPYGSVLWPAALALAHELAMRSLQGKRILELGAGTGLPGLVARSLGAHVVQTDRQKLVLHVCKLNAERNQVETERRLADWTEWTDTTQYDLIVGSDILYAEALHPALEAIFAGNLAPGGSLVISDPFREASLSLFERMQANGWAVSFDKWTVGIKPPLRSIGVFTLSR
jgi:predicted nicotinamide N-methyase